MATQTDETLGERLAREREEKELALQAKVEPFRKAAEARKAEEEKRRQAAEAQKAESLRQAAEAQFDRKHRLPALIQWRATGGSEAEFEKKWPELRERLREELVLKQESEPAPRRSSATF